MERISFTRPAAARIARVVRVVENARPGGQPLETQRQDTLAKARVFRVCTFTGSWSINDIKTVTFKNQTSTPNTVSVTNLVCGMSPAGVCDVSIAKAGTAWYVVQPNLTQLPGYSASGTQVLTIVSGNLRWLGTTACT
jgi:hypothetical protein